MLFIAALRFRISVSLIYFCILSALALFSFSILFHSFSLNFFYSFLESWSFGMDVFSFGITNISCCVARFLHTIFPAALTLISQLSIFMPAFSIYWRTNSTSSLVAGLGFAIFSNPFNYFFLYLICRIFTISSNFCGFSFIYFSAFYI